MFPHRHDTVEWLEILSRQHRANYFRQPVIDRYPAFTELGI